MNNRSNAAPTRKSALENRKLRAGFIDDSSDDSDTAVVTDTANKQHMRLQDNRGDIDCDQRSTSPAPIRPRQMPLAGRRMQQKPASFASRGVNVSRLRMLLGKKDTMPIVNEKTPSQKPQDHSTVRPTVTPLQKNITRKSSNGQGPHDSGQSRSTAQKTRKAENKQTVRDNPKTRHGQDTPPQNLTGQPAMSVSNTDRVLSPDRTSYKFRETSSVQPTQTKKGFAGQVAPNSMPVTPQFFGQRQAEPIELKVHWVKNSEKLIYASPIAKLPANALSNAARQSPKRNAQSIPGEPREFEPPPKKVANGVTLPKSSTPPLRTQRTVPVSRTSPMDIDTITAANEMKKIRTSPTYNLNRITRPSHSTTANDISGQDRLRSKTPTLENKNYQPSSQSSCATAAKRNLDIDGADAEKEKVSNHPDGLPVLTTKPIRQFAVPRQTSAVPNASIFSTKKAIQVHSDPDAIKVEKLTDAANSADAILSVHAEPYFEFSIFQKNWSDGQNEADMFAQELSYRPLSSIDEVNLQAERLFDNTRKQYEQNFQVLFSKWNNTPSTHGCSAFAGTYSSVGHSTRKSHVKIWVQRDFVSKFANQSPKDMKLTPFVSKTVYLLRLFKLVTLAGDSESDDDGPKDDITMRLYQPLPYAELYTAVESANMAAKDLQVEMSHVKEPKSLGKVFQEKNLLSLTESLASLNTGEDGEKGLWKSTFNGSGPGSGKFEIIVERATLCGPRNL